MAVGYRLQRLVAHSGGWLSHSMFLLSENFFAVRKTYRRVGIAHYTFFTHQRAGGSLSTRSAKTW
jgi:hypothetical protein